MRFISVFTLRSRMTTTDRQTAFLDGDFVIFLVGGRFNKPWRVFQVLRTYRLFRAVIRELDEHPECGYLGGEMCL